MQGLHHDQPTIDCPICTSEGAAQITQGERYTHAMPDYLDRAREQFDRYLADEVQLAEATG
jgi:hypothetical protein